jgi:hypothetical protein
MGASLDARPDSLVEWVEQFGRAAASPARRRVEG